MWKSAHFRAGSFCLRSTLILSITERHLLLPHSPARNPVGSPYGSLSSSLARGRLRVYHVSHLNPDGLGPDYSPVARHLRQERFELLLLSTHHFGPSLHDSTFGLSLVTTFIGGLHLLTMPSNPSPRPPWCWQSSSCLAT